jgi:hypothetical protein
LITFLAVALLITLLLSMWKENHYGWLLRGVIWFYLAIVGSCAAIGLQPDARRTPGRQKESLIAWKL